MNIKSREKFINAAKNMYGQDRNIISRKEIYVLVKNKNLDWPNWITNDLELRAARGSYYLKPVSSKNNTKVKNKELNPKPEVMTNNPNLVAMSPETTSFSEKKSEITLVPEKAAGYVPFGFYSDVKSIIEKSIFYPSYITGLSGNGKTMMIEQVHAELKREMIRVNITVETDEDDLIGGFRLQNGATVWQNGPVVIAMIRGCTLLLDEIDLGSNKIMCLQPVLEGKGIFLKKINKMIYPAPGFNVFATANTKGKGSDDGRFIGTNVMNEAFLERFSITFEQEYPNNKIETKILDKVLRSVGVEDSEFIKLLVMWAEIIRETYRNGGISEIISTRRLVHICQAYGIFDKNREKAITLCLNRFDDHTKQSMIQCYEKIDATINPIKTEAKDKENNSGVAEISPDDAPF